MIGNHHQEIQKSLAKYLKENGMPHIKTKILISYPKMA
jgi:hypothetical protein